MLALLSVAAAWAPVALRAPTASLSAEPAMLVPGARQFRPRGGARTLEDASRRRVDMLAPARTLTVRRPPNSKTAARDA